jgi:hypothetical protein
LAAPLEPPVDEEEFEDLAEFSRLPVLASGLLRLRLESEERTVVVAEDPALVLERK